MLKVFFNNRVVADDIEKGFTFGKRLKGLMFKKNMEKGSGILLKPCNSIHMFFMREPIHAIFLDKKCNIVKIYKNLRPGEIVLPINNADMVLELSQKTNIDYLKCGEKLDIK